jgi:hypothetical protein
MNVDVDEKLLKTTEDKYGFSTKVLAVGIAKTFVEKTLPLSCFRDLQIVFGLNR